MNLRHYSQKEKIEIYTKAASLLINNKVDFCCHALPKSENLLEDFPEFKLFRPGTSSAYNVWFWPYYTTPEEEFTDDECREQRIFCLLSCAEIIRQGIAIE